MTNESYVLSTYASFLEQAQIKPLVTPELMVHMQTTYNRTGEIRFALEELLFVVDHEFVPITQTVALQCMAVWSEWNKHRMGWSSMLYKHFHQRLQRFSFSSRMTIACVLSELVTQRSMRSDSTCSINNCPCRKNPYADRFVLFEFGRTSTRVKSQTHASYLYKCDQCDFGCLKSDELLIHFKTHANNENDLWNEDVSGDVLLHYAF